ncbi:ATP-binding protein [Armatimonas sp.]|uniref:ATP-binding protein n=1 Tax=Armatimonas sp. TaxID=1872638 RepID=UPI0037522123
MESLPEVSVAETPVAATAPIVHSLPVAFSRIVFASLAELPLPALILPTLRRALTDAPPAADPLAQIVATINAIQGRVLILLDNLEHLLPTENKDEDSDDEEKSHFGPARIVRQLLESCPDLVVLATSRQPLGVEGEQQVAVEPLVGATGVELFVDRARAVRPDFTLHAGNKAEIEAICTLLDGLPLAIELAAAWVRVLTLKELRERLEKEVLWLEGRRRDLNPRQKSLEATLCWSWQLLSVEQKRLLSALSVFRGGWTLDAIESVHRSPDTLDLLYNLVDKSLVVVEQTSVSTRFRLLETIRQFAHERLEESGEQGSVQANHLVYFKFFAETLAPKLVGFEQKHWYERLEQENGNFRAALAFGTTHRGFAETTQALAGALMKFWWIRGYISEGRDWYEKVLHLPGGQAQTHARAEALYGAGALANFQADYGTAERYNQQSLTIRRLQDNKQGIASSLHAMGNTAFDQKHYRAARAFYEEGLSLRRELGELSGVSTLLNNLGNIAVVLHDLTLAQQFHHESLALKQTLGDRLGMANSFSNLATIATEQGDYPAAKKLCQQALHLHQELGDSPVFAGCLQGCAHLALCENQVHQAAMLFGAASRLREEIGLTLSLHQEENYQQQCDRVRETLGRGAFEAAWQEGRQLSREDVFALVLR